MGVHNKLYLDFTFNKLLIFGTKSQSHHLRPLSEETICKTKIYVEFPLYIFNGSYYSPSDILGFRVATKVKPLHVGSDNTLQNLRLTKVYHAFNYFL